MRVVAVLVVVVVVVVGWSVCVLVGVCVVPGFPLPVFSALSILFCNHSITAHKQQQQQK